MTKVWFTDPDADEDNPGLTYFVVWSDVGPLDNMVGWCRDVEDAVIKASLAITELWTFTEDYELYIWNSDVHAEQKITKYKIQVGVYTSADYRDVQVEHIEKLGTL